MSQEEKPWKTDDFGEPADRDYHYRVPIDTRAFRKLIRMYHLDVRWIDLEPRDMDHLNDFGYITAKTIDKKGVIPGLGNYTCSPDWQKYPSGPGKHEDLEMKNANRGGTQIRGTIFVGGDYGRVPVNFTSAFTPTEILTAYGDGNRTITDPEYGRDGPEITPEEAFDRLQDELYWAEQAGIDAADEAHNKAREKALDSCPHDHTEEVRRHWVWCERCGFEFERDEIDA